MEPNLVSYSPILHRPLLRWPERGRTPRRCPRWRLCSASEGVRRSRPREIAGFQSCGLPGLRIETWGTRLRLPLSVENAFSNERARTIRASAAQCLRCVHPVRW